MKVGLIGFSCSGKSTLFRSAVNTSSKSDVAAVSVPDTRFDDIVDKIKPKKVTPVSIIFHDDIEGFMSQPGKLISQRAIDHCKKVDLLLHVVRAFESSSVPYYDTVDPIRDAQKILEELILLDLQIIENRFDRMKKSPVPKKPGSSEYIEMNLFERLITPLSEGIPLRKLLQDGNIDDNELNILKNYQLLSLKPIIILFNVNESEINTPNPNITKYMENLSDQGITSFTLSACIEEEISNLDAEDQKEFLESLGIQEPAKKKVIKVIYDDLGLMTFYTAGEKETRAWPIRKGSNALKAASTIHTDIAKGFIRAEIIHYKDWENSLSWDEAVRENKMSLEGKEYLMQDGDLINIRCKS